jgi:hypothetical protein
MVTAAYSLFTDGELVLDILLNNGANPLITFDSRPLLAIAAMFDLESSVKMLLSAGADVNDFDGTKTTALMFAATDGYNNIVELLLEAGADTGMLNARRESAIEIARQNDHPDTVEILKGTAGKNP